MSHELCANQIAHQCLSLSLFLWSLTPFPLLNHFIKLCHKGKKKREKSYCSSAAMLPRIGVIYLFHTQPNGDKGYICEGQSDAPPPSPDTWLRDVVWDNQSCGTWSQFAWHLKRDRNAWNHTQSGPSGHPSYSTYLYTHICIGRTLFTFICYKDRCIKWNVADKLCIGIVKMIEPDIVETCLLPQVLLL